MKHLLLITTLSILCALKTIAQPLNLLTYSVGEGLPQSQVFAIAQDSRGYMWFGTQGGGVGRFDGKVFKAFSSANGFPMDYISAIAEAKDKTLWIGSNKGAAMFRAQGTKLCELAGGGAYIATAFVESAKGDWWIGTSKGVLQWNANLGKLERRLFQNDLDKAYINAFFKDEKGVWAATNSGVFLINATANLQTTVPKTAVTAIVKDAAGNYWCNTYSQGVFVLDKNFSLLKNLQQADFQRVLCAFASPDGKIWLGTENKGVMICSATDSLYRNLSENDNLPSNHIRQIFKDSWNNIWIGTSGGGVSKFLQQNFNHYNTKNGLLSDRIYALSEDKTGKIWLAVGNNGVAFYEKNHFQTLLRDSALLNIKSKSLACDADNRLWIATEGNGIFLKDTFGVRQFAQKEGLPSLFIKSLVVDKNKHVWAATQADGIVHIFPKDAKTHSVEVIKNGLPDLFISTLQCDKENKVWFATKNGIVGNLKNGKATIATDLKIPIRSLVFDNQGTMYLGTAGEGIFTIDIEQTKIQAVHLKSEKNYAKNIYLLQFDRDGNLWSGSENGVDKFYLDGQKQVFDLIHYGKNEGFLGIETCQNASLCDQNGNLWFGTLNGVTRHFPNGEGQKTSLPRVHFSSVNLFYQPLEATKYAAFALTSGGLKSGLSLPYHQNHLSFDFKGIHLNSDAPIQYRWQLKGADDNWSPISTQESVNYANLASGDYVFKVQATIDGVHFSEAIEAPFCIEKPFWEAIWFRLLLLSTVAAIIWYIVKKREQRIKAKEAALREQLEIQNKLLTLEQKALQLQMNPHFIFNALNSIQGLVSEQHFQTAREEINNFAMLMRSILSNSRKAKISLQEEFDTLERYLVMEQLCQKSTFDYAFHFSQNIDKEEITLAPMLLQPFVENAVIHGIANLSHRGKIDIHFDLKDDILHCTIIDNGIGRTQAAARQGHQRKGHQSTALAVTEARLQAMFSDASVTPLRISDVLLEDGTVGGTKVEVEILLNF